MAFTTFITRTEAATPRHTAPTRAIVTAILLTMQLELSHLTRIESDSQLSRADRRSSKVVQRPLRRSPGYASFATEAGRGRRREYAAPLRDFGQLEARSINKPFPAEADPEKVREWTQLVQQMGSLRIVLPKLGMVVLRAAGGTSHRVPSWSGRASPIPVISPIP